MVARRYARELRARRVQKQMGLQDSIGLRGVRDVHSPLRSQCALSLLSGTIP